MYCERLKRISGRSPALDLANLHTPGQPLSWQIMRRILSGQDIVRACALNATLATFESVITIGKLAKLCVHILYDCCLLLTVTRTSL